jgi:hypothetical protein
MSRKELVQLVSRALVVFFASWAFADITYLPDHLFELSHHLSHRSVLGGQDQLARYYSLMTFFDLVRIIVFSLAAVWFWRCGERVEAFLSPSAEKSSRGDVAVWKLGPDACQFALVNFAHLDSRGRLSLRGSVTKGRPRRARAAASRLRWSLPQLH